MARAIPKPGSGGGGTTDHALLASNLAWTTSGHTGTPSRFAYFEAVTGVASEKTAAQVLTLLGTVPIVSGGTGQTAKAAAFDALSPGTTKGDLLIYSTTGDRLAASGTDGYALVSDATQAKGLRWAPRTSVLITTRTGGSLDIWYPVPWQTMGQALTAVAMITNRHRAYPLLLDRDHVIDRVAVNVTSAVAATFCRVGLYADDGTGYPGALIADWGELDLTSNGVKSVTGLSQSIVAGTLYHFAVWNVGTSTCRSPALANCIPFLGYDNTLPTTPQLGWNASAAYTAGVSVLPNPYPAGASVVTAVTNLTSPFMRFSS